MRDDETRCRCGKVELRIAGAPSSICHFASCQEALPDDMANYPSHSGKFKLKLLGAWMAMGFRRPAVDGVP